MADENSLGETWRAMLRRYQPNDGGDEGEPSRAEFMEFLEAASRLSPRQLKRLMVAVRAALAEEEGGDRES